MTLTILEAKGPIWASKDKKTINLSVLFKEHEEKYGFIPFTADPNDSEEHGRVLFEEAVKGSYGEIKEPLPVTKYFNERELESRKNSIGSRINKLEERITVLKDAQSLDMITPEELKELQESEQMLILCKKHRVILFRIQPEEGDMIFPDAP